MYMLYVCVWIYALVCVSFITWKIFQECNNFPFKCILFALERCGWSFGCSISFGCIFIMTQKLTKTFSQHRSVWNCCLFHIAIRSPADVKDMQKPKPKPITLIILQSNIKSYFYTLYTTANGVKCSMEYDEKKTLTLNTEEESVYERQR